MCDELMTTITDSRWQLNPGSLLNANESTVIGANLFKYFPERHGRLIVPRQPKEHACMDENGFNARISEFSAFLHRQADNPHFIAMSIAKLPGGAYVIDRLHPFCPPSHIQESENEIES
jgi:hypothetical protein